MADEADVSDERQQYFTDYTIQSAMDAAAAMPAGTAGECIECGEEFSRIVRGLCARCRDKREWIYRR